MRPLLQRLYRTSTVWHRTALHKPPCTASHRTTLHYYAPLHRTAMHCSTVQCNTLHYTALHCTTLTCTRLHQTTACSVLGPVLRGIPCSEQRQWWKQALPRPREDISQEGYFPPKVSQANGHKVGRDRLPLY